MYMYHFHQCRCASLMDFFPQALQRLMDSLGVEHFQVLVLKTEMELAQQDYPAALSRYVAVQCLSHARSLDMTYTSMIKFCFSQH